MSNGFVIKSSITVEGLFAGAPESEVSLPVALGAFGITQPTYIFGEAQHQLGLTAGILMGGDNQGENAPGLPVTGPIYKGLHDRAPSNLRTTSFSIPALYLSYDYFENASQDPDDSDQEVAPTFGVYAGIRPFNEKTLTFEYPQLLTGIFTNASFAAPGLAEHSYVAGAHASIKGVLGLAFQAGTSGGFKMNSDPLLLAAEATLQGPFFGEDHESTLKAYYSNQGDLFSGYGVFASQRSKFPIGEIYASVGVGQREELEQTISGFNAAVSVTPPESNFTFASGFGHYAGTDDSENLLDIGIRYSGTLGDFSPFVGANFVHGWSSADVASQTLFGITVGFVFEKIADFRTNNT